MPRTSSHNQQLQFDFHCEDDQRPAANSGHVREKLRTLKEAAAELGLQYFKLQRAARQGLFPTYTLLNGRRLVRLSEIIAVIERSGSGGAR